jgi:hypothetical protein
MLIYIDYTMHLFENSSKMCGHQYSGDRTRLTIFTSSSSNISVCSVWNYRPFHLALRAIIHCPNKTATRRNRNIVHNKTADYCTLFTRAEGPRRGRSLKFRTHSLVKNYAPALQVYNIQREVLNN